MPRAVRRSGRNTVSVVVSSSASERSSSSSPFSRHPTYCAGRSRALPARRVSASCSIAAAPSSKDRPSRRPSTVRNRSTCGAASVFTPHLPRIARGELEKPRRVQDEEQLPVALGQGRDRSLSRVREQRRQRAHRGGEGVHADDGLDPNRDAPRTHAKQHEAPRRRGVIDAQQPAQIDDGHGFATDA